jgi:hypothetical protein
MRRLSSWSFGKAPIVLLIVVGVALTANAFLTTVGKTRWNEMRPSLYQYIWQLPAMDGERVR